MINSKQKGKEGEREAAKVLTDLLGIRFRRGCQYSGTPESPDVIGHSDIHFEIKRVEKLNIEKAVDQAIRDAGDKVPIVMHRKNRAEWKLTFLAKDLIKIIDIFFKK